ncbi:DNA repair endonuclease XPF [Coccinella septempunctata]|uniref:DNA repair endonuclease XPF n=1 Tax=Coccinella septempunctata TaxID=41139 RepID=UPI001D099E0F|nr:DNA repair endonuclease XPF [Coccinella septempunctata]
MEAGTSASSQSIEDLIEQKCDTKQLLLEFELQLLLDIMHKDGLVIAAKGINMDYVLLNLMKVYCDEGNLVFVMNATEHEEKYFIEKINDPNMHNNLNAASTSDNRGDMYLSGGIHFVSTRILVLDMLKKKIPIEKITGIIILRAHKILESCQESFVLRLYRQNNKTGFIKAFTNSAQSFTMGFGHVERIMRNIFVKELYIWPRFHSLIISSLKRNEPLVIELHVPISENLQKTQTYILELMNLTVKELKRINKSVELEEITTENCLTKKFHKILQSQLDLIWNQLSTRSRQLISDLKTLRHLIISMLYSDPISFYSLLLEYRKAEYARNNNWVLLKPAELLFSHVNSLIFTGDREFNPELCPKWSTLIEVLKVEIPQDIMKSNSVDNKILILCSDRKTCYQLNELLRNGPHHYLFFMALKKGISFKSLSDKFKNCGDLNIASPDETNQKNSSNKRKKLKGEVEKEEKESKDKEVDESENSEDIGEYKESYILTMSQSMIGDESITSTKEEESFVFEPFSQLENINITQLAQAAQAAPTIIIQTFKGAENYINLERTLDVINPNYIVMYHSNITAIREIEMYEAHREKDRKLLIYFLIHAGTVEEQSYLTAMRREKEAFEFLIETKSKMVVPEDQDGKTDSCLNLQNISTQIMEKSTRRGGREEEPKTQHIIVDMREFRSELPVLIHKRGIHLEPYVITVGDYILTPDICIERKSISDLIGSLKSGRLYQQCTQMSRYYSKPMLLIEFDQNKAFSWQNYSSNLEGYSFDQVQQKLLLLTIHFPKLRLIWSPNPYASAQLFEELKQNKEQPNIEYATSIGDEQDFNIIETKYNSGIYDFVRKLPGINSKNIDTFLRRVKNMEGALKLTEDELKDILGNTNDAKAFYMCLHGEHTQDDDTNAKKGKGKFKKGFKSK